MMESMKYRYKKAGVSRDVVGHRRGVHIGKGMPCMHEVKHQRASQCKKVVINCRIILNE